MKGKSVLGPASGPMPLLLPCAVPHMPLLVSTNNPALNNSLPTPKPKGMVEIMSELCKGCELCIYACPSGNLELSQDLNRKGYHPVVFTYTGHRGPCSACGLCYWICPDMAISEVKRLRQ